MKPLTPIPPEQRLRPNDERMQKYTHLAWLCRGVALPLALLAQQTRAAPADAGSGDDAQALISLSTLSVGMQCLIRWTVERASDWRTKSRPQKRPAFQTAPTSGGASQRKLRWRVLEGRAREQPRLRAPGQDEADIPVPAAV